MKGNVINDHLHHLADHAMEDRCVWRHYIDNLPSKKENGKPQKRS